LADKYGLTIPQLSIAWVTTHPAVTSAIVGVKKLEHISSIVAAVDVKLAQDDWHHVAGVLENAKS
jgi:aryl-alcohol dehydrogenase-like predicted oxidoreductase